MENYLLAGDYRGGAFLNAVLITCGIVLIARWDGHNAGVDKILQEKTWDDALSEAVRGYLGVEYREKVITVIKQADRDGLSEETPECM